MRSHTHTLYKPGSNKAINYRAQRLQKEYIFKASEIHANALTVRTPYLNDFYVIITEAK